MAVEANEEYVDLHEWQISAIEEGLQDIAAGRVVDLATVKQECLDTLL